MLNKQQQFGYTSETVAVRYLIKNGYEILAQNYRTKFGEIDIVAKDNETIVFIEVKARTSFKYGSPKAAITAHKKRKMSMLALYYLKRTKQNRVKARFDIVAIRVSQGGRPEIELVKNAFELAYG